MSLQYSKVGTSISLGKSSGVYFIGRLVPALLGFLTIPVFTKNLGVHGYGTFSLIMGSISLLSILSTGWLETTFVRFLGKNGDYAKSYLILLFCSLALVLAVTYGILTVYNTDLNPDVRASTLSAILAFLAIALFRPLMNYYRTYELPQKYTWGMISFSVFRFGIASLLLVFVAQKPSMIFYAYFVVGIIVSFFPLARVISLAKSTASNLAFVKEMIKYGIPYLPMMAASWIFSMYNRFALDQVMGREAVGMYSAAFNISDQSIGFIYVAIMMAVFPRLVKIYDSGNKVRANHLLEHGLSLYAIIVLPAIVGFAFVGRDLLPVLSSKDYLPAGEIIPLLAINTGIVGLNQYFSKPFELGKMTFHLMLIFVFGAAVNMLIVFPLIHLMGLQGAVISNLISLSLISGMLLFFGRKVFRINIPVRIIKRVLLALGVMGITLVIVSSYAPTGIVGLIIEILAGTVTYGILAFRLGLHKEIIKQV